VSNKEIIKKKIIYRSEHRGSKEMDLLLGKFVKSHINDFSETQLNDLSKLLIIEDNILFRSYMEKVPHKSISKNKVFDLFINFKI